MKKHSFTDLPGYNIMFGISYWVCFCLFVQSWDDVVRKERMVDEPFEYKKRVVLDQEKSKQSLSQIYEQEYLKQEKVFSINLDSLLSSRL